MDGPGMLNESNRSHNWHPLPITALSVEADKTLERRRAERQIDDLLRIRAVVLATASGPELGEFNRVYIAALVASESND